MELSNKTALWLLIILIFSGLPKIYTIELHRDFWHDEAFQYLYSENPFMEILTPNDVHPPLFNIFTWGLLHIGIKEIDTLRFTIVVLSLIFLITFFYLTLYLFDQKTALLSTFFIAFSPTFLYYSTEFRNYMFTFIIVLIQIYYFNKMLEEKSANPMILYVLLSLLCLISHYLTGLIILTQFIYVLYIRKPHYISLYGLILALSTPLIFYLSATLNKIGFFWFKNVTWTIFVTTFVYMISYPVMVNLGYPILAFGGVFLFFILIPKVTNVHKQLLFYIVIPPCVGFCLYPILNFYHHRFFLFGAFALYIIMGLILVKLFKNRVVTLISTIFYIILLLNTLYLFPNEINTEIYDSQKYLKDKYDTTEVVFVHTSTFSQSPYKVYFRGNDHYLITNLTRKQLFTAGGSVVDDWELGDGYKERDNLYYVSDKPIKDNIVYEGGGLYVTKD